MKNLFFLFILFIIISCSPNRGVYWCGDHPCINKKEKEAYFKKTMIVEVKSSKNKNYKNISEIEKIMQEAQSKEKKRIKDEKDLTKQIKKSIELNASTENIKIEPSKFSELIKKITKKNILRPYPDINDTSN